MALAAPASAQSLLGVTLGEPIPEGLPEPAGTEVAVPFSRTHWENIEGIAITAVGDVETGEVLFIELRPATGATEAGPIRGLSFGETTRDDLYERFGSEGIVFEQVGRVGAFGSIAAYFTSYEIAGRDVALSFVTIQPLADASEDTAGTSTLDSIVVANDEYLNQIWGFNRGRLPGYAPIPDPFE